ncbi:WD40 domain-containing protein [Lusitaniella coriacea]|uniref:WD40 domain-containing protein n=1 Tax=Lusitaniella coriacea TaxID=1983105 RepID=UPI001E372DBA|nr:AAA-like domain-containing protein [Lusitaniella coriacea]
MPENASTYVTRQADTDLYDALNAGAFCYVLNSRQTGKSSLRVRTMRRLREEGIACAAIDLSFGGTQYVMMEQWYVDMLDTLVESLGLDVDLENWWEERELLSPLRRFRRFIEEILLVEIAGKIVIFIDEIDSILSLNFPTDDFFAFIRACYQERVNNPEFHRLTFCLLGVATPTNLIQDKKRTPFNIGRAIALKGFQPHEVQPLIKGLQGKVEHPERVLEAVLAWTGGQPFLTQKVCHLLASSDLPLRGNESEWVTELVQQHVIENWEAQDEPEHLRTIRDRILSDEQRAGRLLGLYQEILQARELNSEGISADDTLEQMELRLTGLVIQQNGRLKPYNPIYAQVFNGNWVEEALATLRPYAESIDAWITSGHQDESWLLRGEALQDALTWANDRKLADEDYQFLAASQELITQETYQALEAEREAKQILEQANQEAKQKIQKANRRAGIGLVILVISLIAAIASTISALTAKQSEVTAKQEALTAQQEKELAENQKEQIDREKQQKIAEIAVFKQQLEVAQKKVKQSSKAVKNAQSKEKIATGKIASAEQRVISVNSKIAVLDQKTQQNEEQLKQTSNERQTALKQLEQAKREQKKIVRERQIATQELQVAKQELSSAQVERQQTEEQLNQAHESLEQAQAGTKLEITGINTLRQFESSEIESLVSAINNVQSLKKLVNAKFMLQDYPTVSPLFTLREITNNINEKNQFRGRQGSMTNINFSPDSKSIATVSSRMVKLWDTSGQELIEFKISQEIVKGIKLSSEKKYIATEGNDGIVKIWDLSGQQITELRVQPGAFVSVTFSPDGKKIATIRNNEKVEIWDLSGRKLSELKISEEQISSVSFSSDGKRIVTAGNKYAQSGYVIFLSVSCIRLWDLSGHKLAEFEAHQDEINSVNFSPNDQYLVTASEDGTAQIWDILEEPFLKETFFQGQRHPVKTAIFSPDGKFLAIAGANGTIKLWDVSGLYWNRSKGIFAIRSKSSSTLLNEFNGHRGSVNDISFAPDGQYLATVGADGTIRLWTLPKNEISQWDGDIRSPYWVSFSPNGKILATAGRGGVQLWDIYGQALAKLAHPEDVWSISFSPDGKNLATAGEDGFIRIWNLSGQQLAEWKGHQDIIRWVEFSPDEQYIATASADNTAKLWSKSGQQILELTDHQAGVWSASFSPDGKSLVTVGEDSSIRLWSTSGSLISQYESNQKHLYWAIFSPDGQYIATAGSSKDVQLFDLAGNLKVILNPNSLFSHTFNLEEGRTIEKSIFSVSFSPDGQLIATGGIGGSVRVWDLLGRQVAEYKIPGTNINAVSFSPDGQRLAAVGDATTIRLWRMEGLDELITRGCNWLQDYLALHPTKLEELEVCQNESLLKRATPALIREGDELARQGKLEQAISKYKKALEWDSSLNLDTEVRAQRLVQAYNLVQQGEKLAKEGNADEAMAKFQQALVLDPELDFDPETKVRELSLKTR